MFTAEAKQRTLPRMRVNFLIFYDYIVMFNDYVLFQIAMSSVFVKGFFFSLLENLYIFICH